MELFKAQQVIDKHEDFLRACIESYVDAIPERDEKTRDIVIEVITNKAFKPFVLEGYLVRRADVISTVAIDTAHQPL